MNLTSELLFAAIAIAFIVVLVALIRAGTGTGVREAPPEVEPELEAEEEAAAERPPGALKVAPAPAEIEAPAAPIPEPVPVVTRLARGLSKTRSALAGTLSKVTGRERLDEEDLEEVEDALIRADVGVKATQRIVSSIREAKPAPSDLPELLRSALLESLSSDDSSLSIQEGRANVWLIMGVNGVGKTTSIAKLAKRLLEQDRLVVLAAADTFRAAAIDQLGSWADRLGIHMVKHAPGADPGAVVYDAIEHAKAKRVDVVMVDTAGRLHTKSNLMDELRKIRRVAEREAGAVSEALLVLDATVGQNGLAQARAFKEAVGATGVILTKLDGSAKGGIVIAIRDELGVPVKVVGVGEGLEDLEPFDPERFVDALLES